MAAYQKFNLAVQDLCRGLHNFQTGTYKVMLTNTAPVAANHLYADISAGELASGSGYTTGGATVTITDAAAGGTETVSAGAVTWTSTGSMGPFRYAVVYRSDDAGKELWAYFDYGQSITLLVSDSFTVNFNAAGLFSLT